MCHGMHGVVCSFVPLGRCRSGFATPQICASPKYLWFGSVGIGCDSSTNVGLVCSLSFDFIRVEFWGQNCDVFSWIARNVRFWWVLPLFKFSYAFRYAIPSISSVLVTTGGFQRNVKRRYADMELLIREFNENCCYSGWHSVEHFTLDVRLICDKS